MGDLMSFQVRAWLCVAQASLESLHASAESHAKRWDEADGAVGALREEVRAQGQALAGLRERLGEMATEVAAAPRPVTSSNRAMQ